MNLTDQQFEQILDHDHDAVIEGLRAVREFTYTNTPAMYRLDETDDILAAAIKIIQGIPS